MKTPHSIAIAGFAKETLKYLKDAQVDEIWTMNHHWFLDLRKPEAERDLPRVDRLFEMHTPEWFTRKETPDSQEYRRWLGQEHEGLTIYMQQEMDEFPSCVPYPREEVRADLFKHLWRGDQNPEYYTSSVGLMLALAIHMGVKRIEMYGVEMASDTEYADQAPAVEFMMGIANGRGIDIVVHPASRLFNVAVYGYEGVPHLQRPRLETLRAHYEKLREQAHADATKAVEEFNNGTAKDPQEATKANDVRAMYFGAVMILDTLMKEDDVYTSAQRLEEKRDVCMAQEERLKGDVNMQKATAETYIRQKKMDEGRKLWEKYQDTRAELLAHSGARQVIEKLRDECRLRKPVHVLKLMIVE